MLSRRGAWGAVLAGVLFAGCAQDYERFPEKPPCKQGDHCSGAAGIPGVGAGPGGAGGTGGLGGAGGSGGALPEGTDVTGSLSVVVTTSFDQLEPYAGQATITAPSAQGADVSAPFGGAAGSTFSLKGVATGVQWFFVKDETGGATQVFSTWSPVLLPSAQAISLPVIDLDTMTSIATSLPTVGSLSGTAAQIVLKVTRDDLPLAGVAVTSGAGGATLAYDTGPGIYSDAATATGTGGAMILFNTSPSASGKRTITLTDDAMRAFVVEVPVTAGAATIAVYEL